jgi:hypothetical protein
MLIFTYLRRFGLAAFCGGGMAILLYAPPETGFLWLLFLSIPLLVIGLAQTLAAGIGKAIAIRRYLAEETGFRTFSKKVAQSVIGQFKGRHVLISAGLFLGGCVVAFVFPGRLVSVFAMTILLGVSFTCLFRLPFGKPPPDSGLLCFGSPPRKTDPLKAFDLGYHFPTRLAALRLIVAGPTSTSEARDFMTAFDSKRRLRPPAPKAPLSARHEWALRLSGLRAPGIGSLPFALLAVLICLVLPVESVPRLPAPSDIFDLPEFAEPDPDGQDQQNPKDPEQSDTPDPSQGADGGQQDQGADGGQQGQGADGGQQGQGADGGQQGQGADGGQQGQGADGGQQGQGADGGQQGQGADGGQQGQGADGGQQGQGADGGQQGQGADGGQQGQGADGGQQGQGADGGQQDQGADGVQQGQGTDGKEGGGPSQLTFPGTGTEASDGPSLPLTPSPEGTQEDAMILTTRQSVFAPAGHARPVLEIPMPEPSDALTVNTSPIPPRQKLPGWIGELYDLP